MLVQQFQQLGWYTVPLGGVLQRKEDGKKTIPVFEQGWKDKYANTFNQQITPLAGVMTGEKSNIVAIDCDNDATYQLFKSLDPEYKFHFVSKGKPSGGGTIIYRYTPKVETFSINDEFMQLDYYADKGFVYLPTEDNYTKESWVGVQFPELKEMPSSIQSLLGTVAKKVKIPEASSVEKKEVKISHRLAPSIKTFCEAEEYDPRLFKILTPKEYRSNVKYIKQGHVHPNDCVEGNSGQSNYLVRVSAILGADISISKELYVDAMNKINNLFTYPLEMSRFNSTIINPMIEEKTQIDGETVWQYDEHWESMGLIATAGNGDSIESFYDDVRGLYYIINYTKNYIKRSADKSPTLSTLSTIIGQKITPPYYDSTINLVRTKLNPAEPFGHIEGVEEEFNLFKQTEALYVLNNPQYYSPMYKKPEATIKYLETLIPDTYMRNFVLRFMRTKLTTFKYSPIILYFIGAHGSGKDTFVSILANILGEDYIAKPDAKNFLEQYNGWLLDKFIVQLDEYGNKLNSAKDKNEVLGRLKSYTGSPKVQIRAMRQDGFNYEHNASFIITANSQPLPLEVGDRRVAFISTPNRLDIQPWVHDMGGISDVIKKIQDEVLDFCYWLATEYKNLTPSEYVTCPETADKENLILDTLTPSAKLAYMVARCKGAKLQELAEEFNVPDITIGWDKNRIMVDKLEDLYLGMTDNNGDLRSLVSALKKEGLKKSRTTTSAKGTGTSNLYFYQVSGLREFVVNDDPKPIPFTNYEHLITK